MIALLSILGLILIVAAYLYSIKDYLKNPEAFLVQPQQHCCCQQKQKEKITEATEATVEHPNGTVVTTRKIRQWN